jgi:hypothetical protein
MITAEIFAAISRRQSADLETDGIDFATLETCLYWSSVGWHTTSFATFDARFPLDVQGERTAVTARTNTSASLERPALWPMLR